MVQTVMILNAPILKLATSEAGLGTSPLTVECQTNSAAIVPSPTFNTIPATGCTGATQSPGLTGFSLNLTHLQDWAAAETASLSAFSFENDGGTAWFEFTPNSAQPEVKMTGQVYVTAGDFGGTFGDGSAAQATVSWPLVGKPTPSYDTTP